MESIYSKNIEILKMHYPGIWSVMCDYQTNDSREYIMFKANNQEMCIAIQDRDDKYSVIGSMYNPSHLAERFLLQYKGIKDDSVLILYGIGDGIAVRMLLALYPQFSKIIIWEPSVEIFKLLLDNVDITDILLDNRVDILLGKSSDDILYQSVTSQISFAQRNRIQLQALYQYGSYFPEGYSMLRDVMVRFQKYKEADVNSIIRFAKSGMENEIRFVKYLKKSCVLADLKPMVTDKSVCIMVAAGPSLEKNVEYIKMAKGKAFILCVDTAVRYILERGIVPDMIATFDPEKGAGYFENLDLSDIPLLVAGDSDWHAIDSADSKKLFVLNVSNDFYRELYTHENKELLEIDGGGSVGTICFRTAVELGFKTIILVGQDLAFSNDKSHAGCENDLQQSMIYQSYMVDGYYGEKVLTRSDYKDYLDWYNVYIPSLTDVLTINSTEGGAKIHGTVQMPLVDSIQKYCTQDDNWDKIVDDIVPVWADKESEQYLYEKLMCQYHQFKMFDDKLKGTLQLIAGVIEQLNCEKVDVEQLEYVREWTACLTDVIQSEPAMMILMRGMMQEELAERDISSEEKTLVEEALRLYKMQYQYYEHMKTVLCDLIELWGCVMHNLER